MSCTTFAIRCHIDKVTLLILVDAMYYIDAILITETLLIKTILVDVMYYFPFNAIHKIKHSLDNNTQLIVLIVLFLLMFCTSRPTSQSQ